MSLRVFINGMDRLGRLLTRKLFNAEGIEIVGINAVGFTESQLAYLLSHDTVYGDWDVTVYGNDNTGQIVLDRRGIPFYAQPDLSQLSLGELQVDVVLECSGHFSNNPDGTLQQFRNVGAKGCLFCYPINSYPPYVYDVNADQKIDLANVPTSAGSATLNATALLLKVINNSIGINTAFIKDVCSYTADQTLCDNRGRNKSIPTWRAAAQNIVPIPSAESKRIGMLIPQLNGRVLGTTLRTPTIAGGVINATIILSKTYTVDEINTAIENAIKNVGESLAYSTERLVSNDVVSNDSKPIFLSTWTHVKDNVCDVTLLYDNEMGFVNQIVRLLRSSNIVLN